MTSPALTRTPPRTEAEAVTYGWQVYRAAQMTDWPEERQREIGRAVSRLYWELDMHGRLADDEWAREAAPLARSAHAAAALERAAEVTVLLEKYCGGVTA